MKEIVNTYYQCEICSVKYNTPEEATKCEAEHKQSMVITKTRYRSNYPYPIEISISFIDTAKHVTKKYSLNGDSTFN